MTAHQHEAFILSGEPLPVAPVLSDENQDKSELENFHRKLLDYIRRLEVKLSSEEFQTEFTLNPVTKVFSAFLNADLTLTAPSGWVSLDWDTLVRADTAFFSHSLTSSQDEITVLADGFYLFMIQIGTASGTTSTIELRLNEATKGVLDYGHCKSVSHAGNLSLVVGLNAEALDVFTIDAQATTANYVIAEARTRLTILYSRADTLSDHGTGAGEETSGSKGFGLIPDYQT